ncbi:MAG: hypothetical protein AAF214_00130 [Pseudomonadota bacterium]
MTAFPDMIAPQTAAPAAPSTPARTVDGQRWLIRGAQRVGGAACVLAALGLWVQPGAAWDADLALFKMGLSVGLGFVGLAVMQMGRAVPSVDVEIDTIRREVRLVRGQGRARALVSRTRMTDLGPAELHANMLRMWAQDGALVAEVALSDPQMRARLVGALKDAGKL